ncbi:NfeD family protein [Ectothiorhodospira lacustris]|uniref:NfeD family protein n=1 Tax=Ectothiorhodospira lacustris TaxID=2899127 RepID=UPI001EE8F33C|nr:NfeD family protein [Ectothiorhodospira lacustris]MCG5499760.1 NfeD family protein [Ectothiorhodospira lacustris]MCG5509783.1 NfeD family protein [Ectothiorhodospira lacustris]MCG5522303.1 NfeD family protein [Ectothiorhodospira lacustris]
MLQTVLTNPWFWLIAGVILMGLEILIPGVFLLWIGLGAMISAFFVALLPDLPFAWHLMGFSVTMLGSCGLGFWLQRRGRAAQGDAPVMNREIDALLNREYIAATDFVAGRGRVRVGDTTYAAQGPDDVKAGDRVLAFARDGIRLRVRPLHAEEGVATD